MRLSTTEFSDVVLIRDLPIPADVRFRQILVTGVPGSGKGTLLTKLGGWPEEGYLDLSKKGWWKEQMLSLRPREVHLGLPVAGRKHGMAVSDPEWLADRPPTELERIQIPPQKDGWLSTDWRGRYAFDFQLPPDDAVYQARQRRERKATHPVDCGVTLEEVSEQLRAYREVAWHLHQQGVRVYVREQYQGTPRQILQAAEA